MKKIFCKRTFVVLLTLLLMFVTFPLWTLENARADADSMGYGRLVDHNNIEDGIIGAWIWDRDSEDEERCRPPMVFCFYDNGTYEILDWLGDDCEYAFDNDAAEIDTAYWRLDGQRVDLLLDYGDGELQRAFSLGFSKLRDENGHTISTTGNQGGGHSELIAISDEAYSDFKKYIASDWEFFDYDFLEPGLPKLKHMNLAFNNSTNIEFDWGSDLIKGNAAATNSYNINLAKAAIYLCEGTYNGQSDIEYRMKTLGLQNQYSEYFSYTYKAYTSPITLASSIFLNGGNRYLVIAVAVRGTEIEDMDDVLTDINEGVFNDSGFERSGNNGMEVVEDYWNEISSKYDVDEEHTILFVTGHSLGAAVAGQIAGNLQGEIASQNHIFAYTFASPYYETHGKNVSSFTNIHNLVNTEDAVPKFPLGGVRYGIDHTFKGDGTDMLDQHMVTTYLRALLSTNSSSSSSAVKVSSTSIKKLTRAKKAFTVQWKKKSGVTGYQIQYGIKKNFRGAKKVKVAKASATSKKIKKLKSKKKYYVRIRAYKMVNGKTYYSAWSAKKTVKTK